MSRYRGHRRRWRRHARHQMPLMLVTDDHYPGETIEAIGRCLYRYRSELAPLAVAAAVALAGLILHRSHPGWWPGIAGLTASTAAGILLSGRGWLGRAEERVYAAAVTLAAGSWLAAATAHGIGAGPLPGLLALGTLAAALPWWRHRRRRARVRVERTLEAWPGAAEAVGLAGSRVLSAVVDLWGWRARVGLRRGQTVGDVLDKLPAIESGLGTRPGAVRIHPDPDRADRFVLRVLEDDPHAHPIGWPGPSVATITEPVELGLYEDATPVRVALPHRHALVGGIAGSGKSGVLNVILANLAACPDVVLWGIDLKGGMELRPWHPCLDRLATTPREAAALLSDAVRVLDARARKLAHHGARLWQPTPETPALVIVIDEYAELTDEAPGATVAADSIARRGRAVAVTLLAATQRPTQAAMGRGALRSQMDVRICLRVRERRDTDLILGQGAHTAGWHAHTLDAPGKLLLSAPGHDTPRRARAYLLTDNDVQTTARRHADHRPPLDPFSTAAYAPPDAQPPDDADRTGEADEDTGIVDAEIVEDDPENVLWAALRHAPPEGMTVPDLMRATGMRRTWVYDRLQTHADAGRVIQVTRGRWRAHRTDGERP